MAIRCGPPKHFQPHLLLHFNIFIYLFIFILGCAGSILLYVGSPYCCAVSQGSLCFKVHEFLTVAASPVTEHRL